MSWTARELGENEAAFKQLAPKRDVRPFGYVAINSLQIPARTPGRAWPASQRTDINSGKGKTVERRRRKASGLRAIDGVR